MILFASDWGKYPTAKIHLKTSNKSFLRFASLLKKMGIMNHAFMLALINPDLEDVDPYSEDLTPQQMEDIAVECKINPWYFFRECVRVPPNSGDARVPLEANRGNIALFWSFFNHIMIFLIQPRQTGKSFNSDVIDAYLLNIGCANTQINLLTKDDTLRRKNIERLRDIIKELPPYLCMITKADSTNFEEITVRSVGNSYIAHVPQASEKAAYKLGRGLTTAVFKIDELPFQPNAKIAVGSALGATGAAVDQAKRDGEHYGTIFTTTAGKLNDPSGAYTYSLLSGATIWDEKIYDCKNFEELQRFVTKNNPGRNYRINLTFNHRQLGKTDEWLYQKISESTQEGDDADRDYFNRWTTGTSTSPISKEHLEILMNAQRPHDYAHISPPYDNMTLWYIPVEDIGHRMNNGNYVVGLDTSDAAGKDGIEMVVIDVNTLETICTGSFNELNLIDFAYFLCEFLVSFKNTTLVIERRSTASTIIDYLLKLLPTYDIDPFKRIYNRAVHDAQPGDAIWNVLKMPLRNRSPNVYVEYKSSFGFATSATGLGSRKELYSTTLQRSLQLGARGVYSTNLVNQLSSLIRKNGVVDHPPGGHDDAVIAWLIANWFILNGNNLNYYGINRVLANVKLNGDVAARIVDSVSDEQTQLRNKIDSLSKIIEDSEDEFLNMRYESELRYLASQITIDEEESFSVDSLMKRIKEKKMEKRKKRSVASNSSSYGMVPTQNVQMSYGRLNTNHFR